MLVVIFAETGLLIGFFLPGDSLIFISGLFCATSPELLGVDYPTLLISMLIAATLGNTVGYYFGKRVGRNLFKKEDSLLFKKRYLETTKDFYERHGGKALILGRFLPIIRTFAPILAGVIKVDPLKFLVFNIVGAVFWLGGMSGIGYFLGKTNPWVKDYLGWIVLFLILITAIPVVRTYRKERKNSANHESTS